MTPRANILIPLVYACVFGLSSPNGLGKCLSGAESKKSGVRVITYE